jgi:HEAT repeat protein
VADPVTEGRTLVADGIRTLALACRAWAAYPPDHPNVAQAVGAAQARIGDMLAAHGSVAIGVGRTDLRVGVWTFESPQARTLAQTLYLRQVAALRVDRGVQPDELQALVHWLAGPAVPLEPGAPAAGPPGLETARHIHLQPLDYSAIRLREDAEDASARESVSLTDRLLNVLLLWAPDEPGWAGTGPGQGSAPPAEIAMIGWLTDFLQAQAQLEQARGHALGGDGDRNGSGEPGRTPGSGGPGGTEGPGDHAEAGHGGAANTRGAGLAGATAGEAGPPGGSAAGRTPPGLVDASDDAAGGPDDADGVPSRTPLPPQLLARMEQATVSHLEGMSGAGRVLAARQTAQLIMRLPGSLRDSLMRAALRVLAPGADDGEALEAFASTFAPHPVLRAMRQLAADGLPLSRHAQRLVELLASTRTPSTEEELPSPHDLEVLRDELVTLFRDEDVDRYNPEDHLALLTRAMLAWPARTPVELGTIESLGDRVASLTEEGVGRQLAETFLDLLGRYGDDRTAAVLGRLGQLVEGALARGSIEGAAAIIERMGLLAAEETTPETARVALRARLEHLARTETLAALAAALATPGAATGLAAVRLVRLLGPSAVRSLLQVLVEEQVRVRRRRVFDLLSALGSDVVPETTRWLGDPNWYVVRNMIALLHAVGDRSSLGTVRRLTGHADLRVRLEALRSLLDLDPAEGHGYLLNAMGDPDPRAATAAVELAGRQGGPGMLEPLLALLDPWDLRGRRRPARLAALQALGRIGRPEALPRLSRFFRERWGPFPSIIERRAAFESLQGYPADARAGLVERGLRSRDHEIRALCERLRGSRA